MSFDASASLVRPLGCRSSHSPRRHCGLAPRRLAAGPFSRGRAGAFAAGPEQKLRIASVGVGNKGRDDLDCDRLRAGRRDRRTLRRRQRTFLGTPSKRFRRPSPFRDYRVMLDEIGRRRSTP